MKQRTLFNKTTPSKTNEKPRQEKKRTRKTNIPPGSGLHPRDPEICYHPIYCAILRKRIQMLIHSCIYYELNDSLITDSQFDKWAKELVRLQKENPEMSQKVPWYDEFKDWDGTTGFHLPTRHPWVMHKAESLLEYARRVKGEKTD